jgi:hypothetical protein
MTEALQQKPISGTTTTPTNFIVEFCVKLPLWVFLQLLATRHNSMTFPSSSPSHAKYPVMYLKSRHVRAPQPLQPIAGLDLPKAQS